MNEIGRQFEIAVSGEKLLERAISILEQSKIRPMEVKSE